MPSDLALLPRLSGTPEAQDLARQAGRDPSTVTRALHRLERRGLVRTWRDGKRLKASRSGIASEMTAQLFHEFPRLPWQDLLTDAHLDLVAFFSSSSHGPQAGDATSPTSRDACGPYVPKSVRAAARWTGLSVAHTHRLVRDLSQRVILVHGHDGYTLAPEHGLLRDVATLLTAQRVLDEIRETVPGAYPQWQLGPVAIYRAPSDGRVDAQPGGISLLPDYGFPLIEPTRTLLHASWEPGPADAILQTYLQAPTRTLNVVLACLLYRRTRPDDLPQRARAYGVPGLARRIEAYVDDPEGHTGRGFPSATDYRDLASQYGVSA